MKKLNRLKTHHLPFQKEDRRIRVLLPKSYKDSEDKYPVVYMHDGQNAFFEDESFSGQSWGVIETTKFHQHLPDMIFVAIDNGGLNRANEYSAWEIEEKAEELDYMQGGQAWEFGEFLIESVKPFIDETYRTKMDKAHTAMMGSSLGGNITAFMGVEYSAKIGKLGVFSLANWITGNAFNEYIQTEELDPTQKVYIQVGTLEGDSTDRKLMKGNMRQAYINGTLEYYIQLLEGGVPLENIDINIFADETHTEYFWAKHLPKCLEFLSRDW